VDRPELLERHRKVMPSWLSLYYEDPLELVSGKGCVVTDAEGRDYLDFFGGILTTMTGHSVPEVVEAIREQAGRILHTSTLYLIRPMVELAEKIAALSTVPDAKVFFVNSGTEATEAALLLCCGARRSNQVLALRNSYHGRSFTAMSVTGNRSWSASSLSPLQVSGARSPGSATKSSRPPAPPTCARSSRRRRRGTSPALSPSRSRAWAASSSLRTGFSPP
jgi:4-aminobutyrate aminotransferase